MDRERGSDLFPMIAPPALPTFDLALRGYDRRQVDEYLDRLEHDLSVAQADRDAASARIAATEKRLDQLQDELQDARVQAAESDRPTYAGLGKRVAELLTIAEEEAERLRAEAHRDVADERASAGTLIQKAKDKADKATRAFEAEFEERRREAEDRELVARAELDKRLSVAEKRVADAEALAKSRIAEAEAAAEKRMAEARTEADRLVSDATQRSDRVRKEAEQYATAVVQAARHDVERIGLEAKSEADTIISEARAKAEQGRSEHDREIAELIQRRQSIRNQLKALRQVLGSLPDASGDDDDTSPLTQPPAEQADPPQAAANNVAASTAPQSGGSRPAPPATQPIAAQPQSSARPSPAPKHSVNPTPAAKLAPDETAPNKPVEGQPAREDRDRSSENLRKTGS